MKSRYLEEAEVKKLKEVMTDEAFIPIWVSLETGLRVGDVVALRVSQVQADGIHYTAQKTGKKGIAPISAKLRRALPKKGKWLFPSPSKQGRHLTRQAVWVRLKTAGKRANVELDGLSPHALRKVFAVELYRKHGFEAVKKSLQHINSITTEIYTFADWNTGENGDLPLKRRDLQLIVRMVLEALGDNYRVEREEPKQKK